MPAPPSTSESLILDGIRLRLRGTLTASTVTALLARGQEVITEHAGSDLLLDLGEVTNSDSAGLALVVDWIRTARAHGVSMQVTGIPDQLRSIADISGLVPLLSGGTGDEP